MSIGLEQTASRRQWLQHAMRAMILSGLAGLSWMLTGRARKGPCQRAQQPCGDCPLVAQCQDPKEKILKD